MERKGKFSPEDKLKYVLRCIEGEDSIRHTATMIGINYESFRQWIHNYQSLGIDGLITSSKNSSYSKALKETAVKDYLVKADSLPGICKKYGIRSTTQLRRWILKYNSHEELKASGMLKSEMYYLKKFNTYDELEAAVIDYIEYYNNRRYQKRLNCMTPREYRQYLLDKAA